MKPDLQTETQSRGSEISFEDWQGDTDGIARTICYGCGTMVPMNEITECQKCFDPFCGNCRCETHSPNDPAHRPEK